MSFFKPVPVVQGGTGATTASGARTGIELGNVNNTSDANKPVSTAQQTALDLKANLASPTLTGTPAIAAATGTSLAVTGLLKSSSPSAGLGYATGAGGTATQTTSRSTGVTMSPDPCLSGTITGDATALVAGASATFVVTNSAVAIGDVVVLSVRSGPTADTSIFSVSAVTNGTFSIRVSNIALVTSDTGAPIINFAIIKAVSS